MLSKSEPLTDRQPVRTHSVTHTGNTADKGLIHLKEDSMGLKIQNSGLPPVKVLISKKLHILRPAIDYVQLISKQKKVRLWDEVDAVCVVLLLILVGGIWFVVVGVFNVS